MLAAYLAEEAAKPFSWGSSDCATLAIGWADRCLSLDGLSRWRGWYSSEDECAAFIAESGGFEAIASSFVAGIYDLSDADAEPGNVLMARVNGVMMMGVRIDARTAAFRAERYGLITTRFFETLREWGIPCRQS